MKARRDRDLLAGPARLCQAFAITGADNGADLVRGCDPHRRRRRPAAGRARVSTRIGLAAGRGDDHPWRFTVPGDPNLSRP